MGYGFIAGMQDLDIPLKDIVSMHFSSNCYPPIPQEMVDCAVEAIELCNAGDYGDLVQLPEGVTYRGSDKASAYTIVEQHRLDGFVEWED